MGGGDSVTAATRYVDLPNIDYICTAGGAMVRFLSGVRMPLMVAMKDAFSRDYSIIKRKIRVNGGSDFVPHIFQRRVFISMRTYSIASIPGDGVGREITDEAFKILDAAAAKHDFSITRDQFDWGCDYYLKHGVMNPEDILETLKGFDAIYLGCIGDARKVPDHISLQLLLKIRKGFDQYVNLRPIKLYPGVHTPVKTATPDNLDMIVVRENTEGEYSAAGGIFKAGTPDAVAIQTGSIFLQGVRADHEICL